MRLYDHWRSTAAYRVRIALNLKSINAKRVYVHLTRNGGDQHKLAYRNVNPASLVPSLELDDGRVLTQSLAIIEYLEEHYPEPPLLPEASVERAHVRAAAQLITSDVHPLNTLRVGQFMQGELKLDQSSFVGWMHHWMKTGLLSYAELIAPNTPFSFGAMPGVADVCLVAQMYNAERWNLDMTGLARLEDIRERCNDIDAFADARPEHQADAEPAS